MANSESHPSTGDWPRPLGAFRLGDTGVGVATIAVVFLILVTVYLNSFGTLAADDIFFKYSTNGSYFLALANYVNGRLVPAVLFQFLSIAGIEISEIWNFLQITAFIGFATLAYVFVVCLNTKLSRLETLALASIIVALPYNLVLLINKNNALNATAGFLFIAAAIFLYSKNTGVKRVILPAVFLFLTASSYQTTIYYFIIYIFSYYLFNCQNKKEVFAGLIQGLTAFVIAIVAYFIVYKMTGAWAAVQMSLDANADVAQYYGRSRAGLIGLQDVGTSLLIYMLSIGRTLFWDEPVLPLAVKLIGIGAFLVALYTLVCQLRGSHSLSEVERFERRSRLLMLLLLILAVGSPIHIMLVFKALPPRIHAHAGAVWAVLFMTGLLLGPDRWRRAILAVAVIFATGLAYHTGRIATGIETRFERDTVLANAIVADIKRLPDYQPNKPVAFAGEILAGPWNDERLFRYYITMMPSKFDKRWGMLGMLEEATGVRFPRPSKAFLADAKKTCLAPPAGTLFYDVRASSKGAVVCLRSSWLLPESES